MMGGALSKSGGQAAAGWAQLFLAGGGQGRALCCNAPGIEAMELAKVMGSFERCCGV